MKGRTRYVKCFSVGCYRLVLQLNFIVTVEFLYDQAESDFFQCQTKKRAFAYRICSEFKQFELNWNIIVHQIALWSLVFSKTRPWNKQISAPDAGRPSTQERWQVTDLKHLKTSYLFSSEDKFVSLLLVVWSQRSMILFLKYGSYRISLNQRVSLWYGWELRWIELGCVRRSTSQEMK